MRSFFSFGVFFLLCFSSQGQNDMLPQETLDDANPLCFPIDSGFVFFVAEEGKIIFAREETQDFSIADTLIDLGKAEGRLSIVIDQDTTYYTYKLVDVNGVFNPTSRTTAPRAKRYYSPPYVYKKIINYDPAQNMDGISMYRTYLPYREGIQNISYSLRGRQNYFGSYKQSTKELVAYQFSIFENKFAFFTTNSNRIVVFDKLGNVEAFSALNPTEPFLYIKKHQSIYYDEVQEKFYLMNTTNFNYNWYVVNPSSGETKLVQQIKKLVNEPSWWVRDGVLHYSITDNENQTTTLYDVPLY